MGCVFCDIVEGRSPAHIVWEDGCHLAFLSIYPNTPGVTVVIPKEHQGSYAFAAKDDVLADLVLASKQVALLLDEKLEDVGRTGMVLEGFGVDHLHAKLFPMHGTEDMERWERIASKVEKTFDRYEGYLSSHDAKRADDEDLAALAKKIRE